MAGNTFGKAFAVTTFGESHGEALGVIIDGCPAGLELDRDYIQSEMDRRKPGSKKTDCNGNDFFNAAVTSRQEDDKAEILSGVFEGKTTGTPIAIVIKNSNQHSSDYSNIKDSFRPGHADYTFFEKYGIRDYRGGGRSSGRETCARVAAGAVAKLFLKTQGIKITAYTKKAAGIEINKIDFSQIEKNPLRAPDNEVAEKMAAKIEEYREKKDSCGGIVECQIEGLPAGLGEPVFDKMDALLAHAVLSIGAVKGIEFGEGFECASLCGSENNDQMRIKEGKVSFLSNNAGGILGGISNGNTVIFRAAIKPVPSIFKSQKTVNTRNEEVDIEIKGRHDVCLCPRIVPVIEAMAALTLADLILRNRSSRV